MHELSIVLSILEVAEEEASKHDGQRVEAIYLQVGALAGIVNEALLSAFELATEQTAFEGSRLVIEQVPVAIFCAKCQAERPIHSLQDFSCAECDTPASEIVRRPGAATDCFGVGGMTKEPRIIEVRQNVLKRNDEVARALRRRFEQAGLYVVSLVSSPGSGKTAFLEKTLTLLRQRGRRPAALVGDLATDNDAARLARSQAPVKQITTGTLCHLEAAMVEHALDGWNLTELEFLFVENVGNLVCPASYDLGENVRLVLLSVTEGEDKPLKYPTIFNSGDLAVVTKMDLAEAVEFNWELAQANIQAVRPGMPIIQVSAKSGQGMEEWVASLEQARRGD